MGPITRIPPKNLSLGLRTLRILRQMDPTARPLPPAVVVHDLRRGDGEAIARIDAAAHRIASSAGGLAVRRALALSGHLLTETKGDGSELHRLAYQLYAMPTQESFVAASRLLADAVAQSCIDRGVNTYFVCRNAIQNIDVARDRVVHPNVMYGVTVYLGAHRQQPSLFIHDRMHAPYRQCLDLFWRDAMQRTRGRVPPRDKSPQYAGWLIREGARAHLALKLCVHGRTLEVPERIFTAAHQRLQFSWPDVQLCPWEIGGVVSPPVFEGVRMFNLTGLLRQKSSLAFAVIRSFDESRMYLGFTKGQIIQFLAHESKRHAPPGVLPGGQWAIQAMGQIAAAVPNASHVRIDVDMALQGEAIVKSGGTLLQATHDADAARVAVRGLLLQPGSAWRDDQITFSGSS